MAKTYKAILRYREQSGQAQSKELPALPIEEQTTDRVREKLAILYDGIAKKLGHDSPTVITFLGVGSDDGATTLVRKLAELVSQDLGKRVALLQLQATDAHSQYFAAKLEYTLQDVFLGTRRLEDVLRKVDESQLHLGQVTRNVSVSALSPIEGFGCVTDQLRKSFDLVLFDAGTTVRESDALTVAAESDGVVLVVEAEKTRLQVAEYMTRNITASGGEILAVIINRSQHHIPRAIYERL